MMPLEKSRINLIKSCPQEIAAEEMYYPPITIKAFDSRGFGCFKYAGMCSIPTIYVFMQRLITKSEYENAIYHSSRKSQPAAQEHSKNEKRMKQVCYMKGIAHCNVLIYCSGLRLILRVSWRIGFALFAFNNML